MNAHVKMTGTARVAMTSEGLALVLSVSDAALLGLREGESVEVEFPGRSAPAPSEPDRDIRLQRGRDFIDRYREAFIELAK